MSLSDYSVLDVVKLPGSVTLQGVLKIESSESPFRERACDCIKVKCHVEACLFRAFYGV